MPVICHQFAATSAGQMPMTAMTYIHTNITIQTDRHTVRKIFK